MKHDLLKGFTGISSVTLGAVMSTSNIKEWLQISSLVIGCMVGLASFCSIVFKWFTKPPKVP